MIRTLYLIRHGQATEAGRGQKDFDRALTPMGMRDATHMGKLLSDFDVRPDLIISSTALRAKITAEIIADRIRYDNERIEWKEEVYDASVRGLLTVLNGLEVEATTVFMIGHNPAFIYLSEILSQKSIGTLVPCGILQIGFDVNSWSEATQGTGILLNYYVPEKFNNS